MMWTRYRVRWEFLTDLCASVPADPNLQKAWLESRRPTTKPPQARSIDEIAAEVAETTLEVAEEEAKLLVFQRHEFEPDTPVCVMRAATTRAHIKDCAQVLSSLYVGKIEGEKSFAVRVKNALYWDPGQYWIPILTRDGHPITAPTGTFDRAVHIMTPKGPRSAIKTFEYISDAMMDFTLLVLTQPSGKLVVSEADLKTLFTYGGTHGYGGERSYDGGRYVFTITQTQEEA